MTKGIDVLPRVREQCAPSIVLLIKVLLSISILGATSLYRLQKVTISMKVSVRQPQNKAIPTQKKKFPPRSVHDTDQNLHLLWTERGGKVLEGDGFGKG